MKFSSAILIALTGLFVGTFITSCNQAKAEKSSTFKVYGNCGMCEKTIEGALDQNGIYFTDWDKESKIIEVRFDSTAYSLEQIHTIIANAGYDTEIMRAPDVVYDELHECCQYTRPI